MAARGGSALARLCWELSATSRESGGMRALSTTSAAAATCFASMLSPSTSLSSSSPSNRIPFCTASPRSFSSNFTPRGQTRGFRIRDLFNKELAAERKAALRADLAVGHFDDLKGAKTASKPFAAREVPERAALLLPSLDLDVVSKRVASGEEASSSFSSSSSTTLGEVLSEALHGGGRRQQEGYQRRTTTRRGPVLLLLGSRASAEPALDSWAAAWAKAVASSSSSSRSSSSSSSSSPQPPPPPPIVDLTLFDRVSPILLALPGGKSALLRGAAEGARRRGAAAAAAHFGAAGGREIREAIGATNPLAGYGCVLDCRLGTGAAAPLAARVRWIGAGEAGAEEEEGLREVVASLLLLSSKEAEAEAEGGRG